MEIFSAIYPFCRLHCPRRDKNKNNSDFIFVGPWLRTCLQQKWISFLLAFLADKNETILKIPWPSQKLVWANTTSPTVLERQHPSLMMTLSKNSSSVWTAVLQLAASGFTTVVSTFAFVFICPWAARLFMLDASLRIMADGVIWGTNLTAWHNFVVTVDSRQ